MNGRHPLVREVPPIMYDNKSSEYIFLEDLVHFYFGENVGLH